MSDMFLFHFRLTRPGQLVITIRGVCSTQVVFVSHLVSVVYHNRTERVKHMCTPLTPRNRLNA